MLDPGNPWMFELPAGLGDSVFDCVNDCTRKPFPSAEFIKCVKSCCAQYGIGDEDCKVTIVTSKP